MCKAYLIFAILSVLLSLSVAAETNKVVSLTGDPWPPFIDGKVGEEASSGLLREILLRLFEGVEHVDVALPLLPWERALREVELGSQDGISLLLKTPERSEYMAFSEPLIETHTLLFYSRARFPNGFEWQTMGDLDGYQYAAVRGYNYGDLVTAIISSKRNTVVLVNQVEMLFDMLKLGRIDFAVATELVGRYHVKQKHYEDEISAAVKPVNLDVFYIGLSKASGAASLLPEVNQSIRDLKATGYIDNVLR